jgi:transmembrane sensor
MDIPKTADEWFVRLHSGHPVSPQDEADLRAWLAQHPDHEAQLRQCEARWAQLSALSQSPELLARRARALRETSPKTSDVGRRSLFKLAGGGIAAALVLGAGWTALTPGGAQAAYVTAAGERLTTQLPDGSELTLAPLSEAQVTFKGGKREINLLAGQAFITAVRKGGPLSVTAGNCTVEGSGCQFQVTLTAGRADVIIADGGATVRSSDGKVRKLWSGQTLANAGAAASRVAVTDVRTQTEWRHGRLVFRDQPLSEVVADFNRYSSDQFVIEDAQLAGLRLSGSFRYDGVEDFPAALETVLGLEVETSGPHRWAIRKG